MSDCPGEEVRCTCGMPIGFSRRDKDGVAWLYLLISPIPISRLDARCKDCGRMFYWKQSRAIYDQIMRHYPELAMGAVT